MTLDEAIGYIQDLCDVISDQPCGCDVCPYGDTFDGDGICDVMRSINNVVGSDNDKLKPCPFCDDEAELRQEDSDTRWIS